MHWIPRDLGTWGFILGVLTLLFAYPVGLLVDITSPEIQNWWSTRSQASLKKRISLLEQELARLEAIQPLNHYENRLLRGVEELQLLVSGGTYMLLTATLLIFLMLVPRNDPRRLGFGLGFLIALQLTNVAVFAVMRARHGNYRHLRSPVRRVRLRKSIEKLTMKVS